MAERETSLIIYDGQCVFCSNYVRFMRLRDTVGHVELIDARTQDPRIGEYWSQGYDLNEGMSSNIAASCGLIPCAPMR